MSIPLTVETYGSVPGKQFVSKRTILADVRTDIELTIPVAKTGTLTTRTDNTTGTITGASGHGILTGDKIDIFWDGGCRRNVTVGSVSGTVIPISSGSGDNLPLANAALTFQVPTTQAVTLTGNDIVGILAGGDAAKLQLTFYNGTTEVGYVFIEGGSKNYIWDSGNGVTSLLSGDSLTNVKISQSETTARKFSLTMLSN